MFNVEFNTEKETVQNATFKDATHAKGHAISTLKALNGDGDAWVFSPEADTLVFVKSGDTVQLESTLNQDGEVTWIHKTV